MRERLIELRNHFKMSQKEFSSRFSMPQQTYASLESGRCVIRDAYIQLICSAYGVNEEWLRNGTLPMFKQEPDQELEELLRIYDSLSPQLKAFLLQNAKQYKDIQDGMG